MGSGCFQQRFKIMGKLKYNRSYSDNLINIDIIANDLKKNSANKYTTYIGTLVNYYKCNKGYLFRFKNITNAATGELFKEKHNFLFSNTRYFKQVKGGTIYKFKAIPYQNENSYKYFKKYNSFIPLAK